MGTRKWLVGKRVIYGNEKVACRKKKVSSGNEKVDRGNKIVSHGYEKVACRNKMGMRKQLLGTR